MESNNEIPANVVHACQKNHVDAAEWAQKEFYDGWLKAEKERGVRWRAMWFSWHDTGSIYADGYLAACDYYDEIGWPEIQQEEVQDNEKD